VLETSWWSVVPSAIRIESIARVSIVRSVTASSVAPTIVSGRRWTSIVSVPGSAASSSVIAVGTLHIPFLPLSLTDIVNGARLVLFVTSTDESYFISTRFFLLSFTHFLLLLLEQNSWNFER